MKIVTYPASVFGACMSGSVAEKKGFDPAIWTYCVVLLKSAIFLTSCMVGILLFWLCAFFSKSFFQALDKAKAD